MYRQSPFSSQNFQLGIRRSNGQHSNTFKHSTCWKINLIRGIIISELFKSHFHFHFYMKSSFVFIFVFLFFFIESAKSIEKSQENNTRILAMANYDCFFSFFSSSPFLLQRLFLLCLSWHISKQRQILRIQNVCCSFVFLLLLFANFTTDFLFLLLWFHYRPKFTGILLFEIFFDFINFMCEFQALLCVSFEFFPCLLSSLLHK